MNRYLLGNLEDETPVVLVENGYKKQGRGVFCFFLVAFFALFLGGEAWAADPLVDGGVYLINCKNWTNFYLYPASDNYVKVSYNLEKKSYWVAEKVVKNEEVFYRFRSFDEENMEVGSKGIYLGNITPPRTDNAIMYGNYSETNDSFLFKLVPSGSSYAVIPYAYKDDPEKYGWYLDGTGKSVGLRNYTANGNKGLWNFEHAGTAHFELVGPNITGPTPITQGNTSYEFSRGTAQSLLFFGSHLYSILGDNGSTNTTTYVLSYEGTLPDGTTCSISSDKWTLTVGNLPSSAVTITLKCMVTRFQVGNQEIQKEYSFPVIIGEPHSIDDLSDIEDPNGCYFLTADIDNASGHTTISNFTGFFDGQHHTIKGLDAPIFGTMTNAVVRNVNLENVAIGTRDTDNTGSIANVVNGASRIYNVGILSGSVGGSGNTGGLVGLLDGTARVINCFSFADITSGGGQTGTYVGGLVGNNSQTSNQTDIKTIVVNCMFYGDIDVDHCSNFAPVYGNKPIKNEFDNGITPYCYFSREKGTFAKSTGYTIDKYNRSWPMNEEYLTRFEYFRSILNSNRRLMAWWTTGNIADTALISKWVIDPSIAPYPVLKKWGKYPSIINPDPIKVWDTANGGRWVQRTAAIPYQGKKLGELTVTIKTGAHPGTVGQSVINNASRTLVITDMDTTSYDYCYGKVQLPYYNDVFGDPTSSDYTTRYHGNYTDSVVTAWKITAVTTDGSVQTYNEFVKDWEKGYNFADRYCIDKDIYSENDGRAFAQGGYYYVPEGVTGITIEAYWGKAFYLQAKDNYLDRVKVPKTKNYGSPFIPAGTLPTSFTYYNNQSINVYNEFNAVMTAIKANTTCNVYDQALVLLSNFPLHAENDFTASIRNDGKGGVTFMSADFDLDNEPDFCFPFQWREASNYTRWPIMPFRFDFLPIPELGMAMRHDKYAYSIGIFVPTGHFEITETSFIYTTQFEYMSSYTVSGNPINHQKPLILNGGQYEQIVCHGEHGGQNGTDIVNYTRNIIMGGHIWMKRFTPGSHSGRQCRVRHCAVSVMGGEFPEFYLSGLYRSTVNSSLAIDDSPHCYTNGGRFGIMAGAATESVKKDVVFKIDHSIIREFYGGGCNGANPVEGNIDVTINNSLVLDKYCGGPKLGEMNQDKDVTTHATGTHFLGDFYGGGNGGTNLYRDQIKDETPSNMPTESQWRSTYGFNTFNPVHGGSTFDESKGYYAEFEFEVFNQSNGLSDHAVARTYYHWAQFGTTRTGNVINRLTDCIIEGNFYGGGNLGNVGGDELGEKSVTSELINDTIYGSVFGGGFSAEIPTFSAHDKATVSFPTRDAAGLVVPATIDYQKEDGKVIEFQWCYKVSNTETIPPGVNIPATATTANPTFSDNGKWYCLTTKSLENLGAVSGDVTLTLKGTTKVGGDVFGGGDMSAVDGNTVVKLHDKTEVVGNVFGGGNKGKVNSDSSVTIEDEPQNP